MLLLQYFAGVSFNRSGSMETVSAVFVSYERIVCQLPRVGSYYVSVTNKQELSVSVSVLVQTYTATCFKCAPEGCALKVRFLLYIITCVFTL